MRLLGAPTTAGRSGGVSFGDSNPCCPAQRASDSNLTATLADAGENNGPSEHRNDECPKENGCTRTRGQSPLALLICGGWFDSNAARHVSNTSPLAQARWIVHVRSHNAAAR